jgi:hypothetical protein
MVSSSMGNLLEIILLSGIGLGVRHVFFALTMRQQNTCFCNATLHVLYGQSSKQLHLYPPTSIANVFRNWIHGIDYKFRILLRVGAMAF